MPELPEIANRAREMDEALVGRTITHIEVHQPKCLNVDEETFVTALTGARIESVSYRGKWIFVKTTRGHLLLSLGMGGEILLVTRETLPEKYRFVFDLDDGRCLTINFWWFGYVHYAAPGALDEHAMTAKLGPNALDVTADELKGLLEGRRGRIKNYLLNQSFIAGIGNFYVHDLLFLAGLHPLRTADTLSEKDVERLAHAIRGALRPALEKGGAFYEVDLYGKEGGFVREEILVGYREDELCPRCATPIEKIKTGSTTSFVCPRCQPLD